MLLSGVNLYLFQCGRIVSLRLLIIFGISREFLFAVFNLEGIFFTMAKNSKSSTCNIVVCRL